MTRLDFFIESAKFEIWAIEEAKILIACFTFWRSPEQQLIEYNAKRSKLKYGKHQEWRAKDYMVVEDLDGDLIIDKNEIRWSFNPNHPDDPYLKLGIEWEKRGGIWGGRFENLFDCYHFEG